MVEHNLAKVGAVGSNPIIRSNSYKNINMAKFIVLICYIFLSSNVEAKEKPYKTITIKNKIRFFNTTSIQYLDTIVHVGLVELKIDSIIVNISPMTDPYYLDNDFKAYVQSKGIQYIIWIDEREKDDAVKILAKRSLTGLIAEKEQK